MSEVKTYQAEGLTFEFTPDGSPFEGLLMVTTPEATFSASVNLTKLRSRALWAKGMSDDYNTDVSRLKRALNEICTLRIEEVAAAERAGQEEDTATQASDISPERHEAAMKLLQSADLLEEAAADMELLGHVGERATKKLAMICALSAKSGRPIQPSTHAQSSAGKNALWDATLALLPGEMIVRRSGLTAKALFRTEADLKGAVLYLQEVAGSEDANYSIRVMQSDGRLEYEATEKAPDGSMKNVVYRTEGPTVIVQTTTKNHLHPENETRVFPIYIDESEEQTGRIVKSILKEAAGAGVNAAERERVRERWHDAIRLLEHELEVVIPYAERIEIPNSPIRIRRDAGRIVDVVRVIAWLHQHSRGRDDTGRIVATEEDFHAGLRLVSESLTRAWRTLTPAEETVLTGIEKLHEQLKTRGFRRRDLKVKSVSDRRIKEVLKSLTDTGYLDCDGRQGPQGYLYTVAREAEEVSLNISLRPSPDSAESPIGKGNTTGRDAFARYRPVPDSEEQAGTYRAAGATGRNGYRPIKDADLQEKHATGRTGGGNKEETINKPRPLTEEEVQEARALIREGMAPHMARAEILKNKEGV